jgi:uncharacterized protein (UPF0303 family)
MVKTKAITSRGSGQREYHGLARRGLLEYCPLSPPVGATLEMWEHMDIETLEAEERRLVLTRFDESVAVDLGMALVAEARRDALPIVIDIRTPDRTLFHAAMPGATPLNDNWAQRKSSTALMFHASSLRVGTRLAAKRDSLAAQGLPEADFADHGGSIPIRVAGVGVVAAVTVSGLPSVEDHALVVRMIEALMPTL